MLSTKFNQKSKLHRGRGKSFVFCTSNRRRGKGWVGHLRKIKYIVPQPLLSSATAYVCTFRDGVPRKGRKVFD